jgi:hypothetical protein
MPPNPSDDLKRQRRQRHRHDHEHGLRGLVMPPNPWEDLAKLAGQRPNDGRLALRPFRMVATSPSIGAGRSALRHPGCDRSLGCAHASCGHAGTVAQRPRYAPPQSDFAVVIEIVDYAAPIRCLPIFFATREVSWPEAGAMATAPAAGF